MVSKKIVMVLTAILVMSSFMVFVPMSSDETEAADGPFMIKDHWGREITFDAPIEKIAVFGTAFAATVSDLGYLDSIVMADTYSIAALDDLDLDKGYSFTTEFDAIGQRLNDNEGGFDKDRDAVVIYGYASYEAGRDKLANEYGLKVIGMYPSNFDNTIDCVKTIGKLYGIAENDNSAAKDMERAKTYFTDELSKNGITDDKKVPVVYVGYTSSNFTAGNDASFTASLIRLAGGVNAASDSSKGSSYAIAPGDIELMGAEIVFLDGNYSKSVAEFRSEMHISSDVKIYQLGKTMNTYAPSAYDGIKLMASAMYPDIFGDIDDNGEGFLQDSMWYIVAAICVILLIVVVVIVVRRGKTI